MLWTIAPPFLLFLICVFSAAWVAGKAKSPTHEQLEALCADTEEQIKFLGVAMRNKDYYDQYECLSCIAKKKRCLHMHRQDGIWQYAVESTPKARTSWQEYLQQARPQSSEALAFQMQMLEAAKQQQEAQAQQRKWEAEKAAYQLQALIEAGPLSPLFPKPPAKK